MIEVFQDKETYLNFDLNITGNNSSPIASLIMDIGSGVQLQFSCKIENSVIHCIIPQISTFIKDSIVSLNGDISLEVIVDGYYYCIWEDTFILKKSIIISANLHNNIEQKIVGSSYIEGIVNSQEKQNIVLAASLKEEKKEEPIIEKEVPVSKEVETVKAVEKKKSVSKFKTIEELYTAISNKHKNAKYIKDAIYKCTSVEEALEKYNDMKEVLILGDSK